MSKDKNRGNREVRKPKKVEPKVNASKPSLKAVVGIEPSGGLNVHTRKDR